MSISFAVDRLYQTGWLPTEEMKLERLPSGLRYPTVSAVQKLFSEAGLTLTIKPQLMFGCCRADWVGDGDVAGTVVGSCEAEAAVFALAKLREQQFEARTEREQSSLELAAV
jgi:hypothetical protein